MGTRGAETAEWSEERVLRATRRSLGLVALSYTPYFPALFERELAERIRPPSAIDFDPTDVADPWPIRAAGNLYFVPGRLADLLDYTSCVVAACPAIRRAWSHAGASADCGPPSWDELLAGRVGERPWKTYWNEFHRRSAAVAASGRRWVLDADIERCAESIDGAALAGLLSEWGADPDAVRTLAAMHRVWAERGFPGLPVIGTFGLLTRMYLLAVEERLRREGIVFLRALDDFRIFCREPGERDPALLLLRESLADLGLRLNESKTTLRPFGTSRAIGRRWLLIARGKVRYGVARPALVGLTRRPELRPFALAALRLMVRRRAG